MITVLTLPRTGSTWYCEYLSKLHNYRNLKEYFDDDSWNTNLSQLKGLNYLESNPDSILKVFPSQLKHNVGDINHVTQTSITTPRRPNFDKHVLNLSKKTYLLIRKDFQSQCISYYLASINDTFVVTHTDHEYIVFDQQRWDNVVNNLLQEYKDLGEYYKHYDCELIDYSELPFNTTPHLKKYVRPVTWDFKPDIIDIDILSFFNKKGT